MVFRKEIKGFESLGNVWVWDKEGLIGKVNGYGLEYMKYGFSKYSLYICLMISKVFFVYG